MDTQQTRTFRVATAAGLGVAATVASVLLDIPGRGEFVVTSWIAGALAAIVLPGRWSLVAGVAGVIVGGVAAPLMGASITLLALALGIVAGLFAHGWLSASVVPRLRRDGLAAVFTPAVLAGLAIVVLAIGAGVWFAIQFAANPA
jgi:hypothetical protein